MAHDATTRAQLRAKYIGGMPLAGAAEAVGVPYGTARRWKASEAEAGNDWDIARNARRMSKSGLEEMANQVLGELAEQFLTTINTLKQDEKLDAEKRSRILIGLLDGYNKAIAATSRAMPNANRLATAMEVIRWLGSYISDKHPTLRGQFLEVVEGAGDAIVAEFGSTGA